MQSKNYINMKRWILPVLLLLLGGCLNAQHLRVRNGEVSPRILRLLETEVDTTKLRNVKHMEIMLDHVERFRRLLENHIANDQMRITILIDSELASFPWVSGGPFSDDHNTFIFVVPIYMSVKNILDQYFCHEGISEWVVESDAIVIRRIPGKERSNYLMSTNNPFGGVRVSPGSQSQLKIANSDHDEAANP